MPEYLDTVDVWIVLDLIVAEFKSDPQSVQCFDARLVKRAIQLNDEWVAKWRTDRLTELR